MKLWMIKLGATPPGRFIEQHDVFFGFAEQLSDLVADLDFFGQKPKINGTSTLGVK